MIKHVTKQGLVYGGVLLLAVLIIFHLKFGLAIIWPGNDRWLYGWSSDMLPDICTWQYYRYSPLWQGAPGVFIGYGHPQVTGIGNTNIVPLIGMPLKLLNGWLPEHFQYLGFFLFACYGLQAWFADRLLAILGLELGPWRLGGVIIALMAAPFLDRYCHLALCAHWIILAALCIYFSGRMGTRKKLWGYGALSFAAILIHPYLILFPLLIAVADGIKRARQERKWGYFFVFLLSSILPVIAGAYISGMFSLDMSGGSAGGFGVYSSNLNTFWNNLGKTNLSILSLPSYGTGQYEGYAYLGAGVLLLWISLFVQKDFYLALKRSLRSHWPLLIVLVIALIYALAFRLTWNAHLLWDPKLGERTFVYRMASVFRSSGRYIWLPFYIMLFIPVIYYGHRLQQRKIWSAVVVSGVLLLQIMDLSRALQRGVFEENYQVGSDWVSLAALCKEANMVCTYPLFQRDLVVTDDIQYLTAALAPLQIPITAGHLPRPDLAAQQKMTDTLQAMSDEGRWLLDPKAILLTKPQEIAYFVSLQDRQEIKIRSLGAYRIIYAVVNRYFDSVCTSMNLPYSEIKVTGLADYLKTQNSQYIMVLVSQDEASAALKPGMREALGTFSPVLGGIQQNEAYAAICYKGKIIKEAKTPKGQDLDMKYTLQNRENGPVLFELRATSQNKQYPYLKVNGKEMHHLNRGINIFIFDEQMQLIAQDYVDLYKTYYMNR